MLGRYRYIILAASILVLLIISPLLIRAILIFREERRMSEMPLSSAGGTLYIDKVFDPLQPAEVVSGWPWYSRLAVRFGVFSVQVDNLSPVFVTTANSSRIKNLETDKSHIVRIRLNGIPHSSFRFNFKDYPSTTLHLEYYTYGDWIFDKETNRECEPDFRGVRCRP